MSKVVSRRHALQLVGAAAALGSIGGLGDPAMAAPLPPPGPGTVGVPAGTRLTVRNGDLHTTAANQVISNLDLRGSLYVDHPGVVVRRSKIGGKVIVAEYTPNSVRMEWCTVHNPGLLKGLAVSVSGVSLYRCDIGGFNDAVHVRGDNTLVQECWLHSLYRWPMQNGKPVHCDAGEFTRGRNIRIIGNRIDAFSYSAGQNPATASGQTLSCLMITSGSGALDDVLVQGNTMRGRTLCHVFVIRSERPTNVGQPTNVRFVDNWFDRGFSRSIMQYAPRSVTVWQNNRWLDTGAQIPKP